MKKASNNAFVSGLVSLVQSMELVDDVIDALEAARDEGGKAPPKTGDPEIDDMARKMGVPQKHSHQGPRRLAGGAFEVPTMRPSDVRKLGRAG